MPDMYVPESAIWVGAQICWYHRSDPLGLRCEVFLGEGRLAQHVAIADALLFPCG